MRIRRMRIEDYDAVAALWDAAGLEHRPDGRDSREAIAKQLEPNGDFMLVAESEGRIVGCVVGSHDQRKGWVNRLATLPEMRRRGVARALTARLEEALRDAGIGIFAATVYADNSASAALLESMGYTCPPNVRYFSKRIRKDV